MAEEIWHLQYALEKHSPKQVARILENPCFRAAYDFLILRAEIGEISSESPEWWTSFQKKPT